MWPPAAASINGVVPSWKHKLSCVNYILTISRILHQISHFFFKVCKMFMGARKIEPTLQFWISPPQLTFWKKDERFCRIFRGRTTFLAFIRKIEHDREIQITDFVIDCVVSHALKSSQLFLIIRYSLVLVDSTFCKFFQIFKKENARTLSLQSTWTRPESSRASSLLASPLAAARCNSTSQGDSFYKRTWLLFENS